MRLLVISHTEHYRKDGRVLGWGPTVRELSRLAQLFDEVVHVAPLHAGPAPVSALPYEAANVELVPVRPAGGGSLPAKLGILGAWAGYLRVLLPELRRCDVVHVRCPSNIGLLAILALTVLKAPRLRWIKYAGNWRPDLPESPSYSLQRWLLRRGIGRAVVTVNGSWPDQPAHVRPFLNPCLTEEELRDGARVGRVKELTSPVRLLFVGRVEESKGCGRAVDVVEHLRRSGVDVQLDIVGDGPDRLPLSSRVEGSGLGDRVRLLGGLARPEVNRLYGEAHVLLFPSSSSEGWPKVLSEGMAYGVVPVASDISSIPQSLREFQTGRALAAGRPQDFADAIGWYAAHPAAWKTESLRAVEAASRFGYARYLQAVQSLLSLPRPESGREGSPFSQEV